VRYLERLWSWYLVPVLIMGNWDINSLCKVLEPKLQRKAGEEQRVESGLLGSILSFLSLCLNQLRWFFSFMWV